MPKPNSKRVSEAAALLTLFSFFALIEGIIRMTSNSKPAVGVDYWDTAEGTKVPVGAFLAAGVAEVLFGTTGIFVGFFQLFFEQGSTAITIAFAILQAVLGWFVFLTFVIAAPVLAARGTMGNDLLSQNEHRALIIFGNLLGSVNFCWALQGGQFVMIMRLLAAQKNQPENLGRNALRSKVWAMNQVVAAGSTLFVGFLLLSKDFTSTTAPVGAPPHVVWFPLISIITGAIMLAYGVAAMVASGNIHAADRLPVLFVLCTLAMMVNFSWTFGIVPGLAPPIPGAAQHAGLVFSVTLLPIIHAWRAHYPLEDGGEGVATTTTTITKTVAQAPCPEQPMQQKPQQQQLHQNSRISNYDMEEFSA